MKVAGLMPLISEKLKFITEVIGVADTLPKAQPGINSY
jgi:hypothetical protein